MMDIPKISDSEWEVMKIIWDSNPCTSNEIVERISEFSDWKPKTIKTLINRLVKKEVLGYEVDSKDKKTYHYYPLIPKEKCVKVESKSFIKRVFNGSLNMMMANFIDNESLSQEEIDELKDILNKKKG